MRYHRKKELRPARLIVNGNELNGIADLKERKKLAQARNRLEDLKMIKEAGLNISDFRDELNVRCNSRRPNDDLVTLGLV